MRRLYWMLPLAACAQAPDADWEDTKRWVAESFPGVPRTTVAELATRLGEPGTWPLLLDARSDAEFAVSHLRNARWAEDEAAALRILDEHPQDAEVVVYCSVGYRSGALAAQLRARGYHGVTNLEGSLFEWANEGLPLWSVQGPVVHVHPFDDEWGRLLMPRYRAKVQ